MFSWICPQCGHEVPPSKTDCPYCAERAKESGAAVISAAQPQAERATQPPAWQPPAAAPAWQPLPPVQPSPATGYPPPYTQTQAPSGPPYYALQQPPPSAAPAGAAWHEPPRAQRAATPTWLLGIGFAIGFLVLLGAIYYGIQRFGSGSAAEKAGVENPANPSRQKVSNPLQKYVEISGLRMNTVNKKPVAKFVVVNHSNAEISDLAGNVTLWASTSRSEEDSIGSFNFSIPNLAAGASEEITAPLKTKLKMYELPDWQNATAELQITSPPPPQ